MARTSTTPGWQVALMILTGAVVGVVVVNCLYWAQSVFIPVALAVFLSFLLAPLVSALQRRGLRRLLSVLLVVTLAGVLLGGVMWLVTVQATSLAGEVPKHTENIKSKVKWLRELGQTSITSRLKNMNEEIAREWNRPAVREAGADRADPAAAESVKPTAVVLEPVVPTWLTRMPAVVNSLLASLAGLVLTLVLAVFMLLKREDLRNRLIRLASHGQVNLMTKAMEDAGRRISRFLLMQLIVNAAVGLLVGIGLLAIGVQYAFLWGFLVAVVRYIPYVGVWFAAVPPIILSLAMFPGWIPTLLVVVLFLTIELLASNVAEPRLYGRSIGVSEVALLVAAAFWAFLWGPIGLVLSSPLTVCLAVMGKYVPSLKFLDVLLGDEPPLDGHVTFYQRLLADDPDEAAQLVFAHAAAASPDQIYDDFLIPALIYAKRDRAREALTESDQHPVLQAMREILEDLGERRATVTQTGEAVQAQEPGDASAPIRLRILACAARDRPDRLALEMLRQLLDPSRWGVEIAAVDMTTAEFVAHAAERMPALICIGALPPGGLAHTRYLCKTLRNRFPKIRIVVGRWGLSGNVEETRVQLADAGADLTATTLLETRSQLMSLQSILATEQAQAAADQGRLAAKGKQRGVA